MTIKQKTKKLMRAALTAVLTLSLCACAGKDSLLKEARETVIPDSLYAKDERAEGSLWPGVTYENMLASDAKASRAGDIITILVEENIDSTQTATTDTDKTTTIELESGRLLGLPSNLGIQNFLGSGNGFDPNLDATVARSNQGNGTTTRSGQLTATISAVVMEAYPNGNMKIQAKRALTINFEEQTMLLSGVVRPADINFDNTVSSTKVAALEITYVGKGVITDEQRVGWAYRILGWVWPF